MTAGKLANAGTYTSLLGRPLADQVNLVPEWPPAGYHHTSVICLSLHSHLPQIRGEAEGKLSSSLLLGYIQAVQPQDRTAYLLSLTFLTYKVWIIIPASWVAVRIQEMTPVKVLSTVPCTQLVLNKAGLDSKSSDKPSRIAQLNGWREGRASEKQACALRPCFGMEGRRRPRTTTHEFLLQSSCSWGTDATLGVLEQGDIP